MSQEMPHILIVPGLYPPGCEAAQYYMYNVAAHGWRTDGYEITVQQFGWNDRVPLDDRQAGLLKTIDTLPDHLIGIGASAGGLAVINAFRERPEKFSDIFTIASPLNVAETDLNSINDNPFVPIPRLLREAYHQTDDFLCGLDATGLTKIISFHGKSDPRVSPRWSRRPGIVSYKLPTQGHAQTIMGALWRYRGEMQRLAKEGY